MTYADPGFLVREAARSPSARFQRAAMIALVVAVSYYLGARLGFALTMRPTPTSTLWPPNSILLAAFLLTPVSMWWLIIAAAFPAHLAVELNSGFPAELVLGWFVSNCAEALIGAILVRKLIKRRIRFDRSRDVGIFIVAAAFAGTILSSFVDAALVTWTVSATSPFWTIWRTRTASNVLATLTLVPLMMSWATTTSADFIGASVMRYIEAAILSVLMLVVSQFVLNGQLNNSPVLLYAPLPLLLWAAIRFGPRGATAGLMTVTLLAIWGAVHGHGPFLTMSPAENVLSIQLFLIVIAVPLLTLAALTREQQQAERFARESKERLDLAMGAAQAGAWEWRIPENQVTLSDKSKQIFGLPGAGPDLTMEELLVLVNEEDRLSLSTTIRDAVLRGIPYETEFRIVQANSTRWVLGKGKALYDQAGRPTRLLGVNLDITERKWAEDLRLEEMTLRESEAQFRELADGMPQIVWTAKPDGQIDYFNRRWYEFTGSDGLGPIGDPFLLTHPADRQAAIDAWQHAVARGTPCEVEHRLQASNGKDFRWHLARAFPVRDSTGTVLRWYGSCTDIHDQKKVEQELRNLGIDLELRVTERTAELSTAIARLREEIESRTNVERALRSSDERFAKAFHSSPDAIGILRQSDFRFIEINETWEAMFGHTRTAVIGCSADEIGLTLPEDERSVGQALAEGGEFEIRTMSGERLHVAMVNDTVDMAGEACYLVTIRDLTELRRSETTRREQQRELALLGRAAALGELSGALAHELNQPLAAILANARAAQRLMSSGESHEPEVREILEDIAADDRRAGEVIARLRALLRKGDIQPRPINLGDVVREVLAIVHSDLIQRRVSVTTEVSPSLPRVYGDRVHLQQVLLNLVMNASDAMRDTPLGDRRLTISVTLTAGSVQVTVRDTGTGISTARLERIFDPFVTTKENGLGLGLAICRSIVAAHNGRLWAANNEDRGATFFMALEPVSAATQLAADSDGTSGEMPAFRLLGT